MRDDGCPAFEWDPSVCRLNTNWITQLIARSVVSVSTTFDFAFCVMAGLLFTPKDLMNAIKAVDLAKTTRILKSGLDPNLPDGRQPPALVQAVRVQSKKLVAALLDHKADCDVVYTRTRRRPLAYAAQAGNVDILCRLLDAGANPNRVISMGVSPLRAAASSNNVRVMHILFERGATLDGMMDETNGDYPPIVFACRDYDVGGEALSCLLQNGGSATSPAPDGTTPLHIVSGRPNVAKAKVLLKAGANPNARGLDGATPLHCVASSMWRESIAVIDLLLQYGADPEAKTDDGTTPLEIAQARPGMDLVIRRLEDAVAEAKK